MRETYDALKAALNDVRGVIDIISMSRKCGINKHNIRQLHFLEEALHTRLQKATDNLAIADKSLREGK